GELILYLLFAITVQTFAGESVESLVSKALANSQSELQTVDDLRAGRNFIVGEPTLEFESTGSGPDGTNFREGKQKFSLDFKIKSFTEFGSGSKLVAAQKESIRLLKDQARANIIERVYLVILQNKYL